MSELYTHPATGAYPGSASGYLYREEMDALTSPDVRMAATSAGLTLGRFTDF
jgi:hypothetical protein